MQQRNETKRSLGVCHTLPGIDLAACAGTDCALKHLRRRVSTWLASFILNTGTWTGSNTGARGSGRPGLAAKCAAGSGRARSTSGFAARAVPGPDCLRTPSRPAQTPPGEGSARAAPSLRPGEALALHGSPGARRLSASRPRPADLKSGGAKLQIKKSPKMRYFRTNSTASVSEALPMNRRVTGSLLPPKSQLGVIHHDGNVRYPL